MLYGQILAYLKPRNIVSSEKYFKLSNDGNGEVIVAWDDKILGPQPTASDLAAVDASAAIDALKDNVIDAETITQVMTAMLHFHERERFKDKLGRYPTPEELDPLVVAARGQFRTILKGLL